MGSGRRHHAGHDGRAIEEHGAGTALTLGTALFRPDQLTFFSQQSKQRLALPAAELIGFAVNRSFNRLIGIVMIGVRQALAPMVLLWTPQHHRVARNLIPLFFFLDQPQRTDGGRLDHLLPIFL